MKKLLLFVTGFAAFFSLIGCTKKTINDNTTAADSKTTIPQIENNYEPLLSDSLPVIRITSSTGNNDFVTDPISGVVKEQEKTWGGTAYKSNPEPYYVNCTISVTDDKGESTLDNVNAKVKVRGNWTTTYDKKPLRIKFEEKQSMLGLNGNEDMKNWVLLACYKDWSMLRDASILYLSKLMSNYYSSDFRLVEVYINDSYWGVYLLAEQQQVQKHRINITSIDDYTGTDIGYFIEFDGYANYEEENQHFSIDYKHSLYDCNGKKISKFLEGYTIKNDIYSKEQTDFISNYMNKLWELCYEAIINNNYLKFDETYSTLVPSDATDSYEVISQYVDIYSLIDAYVIQEIVCDPDCYFSSFFMDVDFGESGNKKLTFEAPWDFDSTMGNKNFCINGEGLYAAAASTDVNGDGVEANPWMILFGNCDWFKQLVKKKWQNMDKDQVFIKVLNYIDTCTTKYEEAFARNYGKWGNINRNDLVGDELTKDAAACKTQAEAATYLKGWLIKRVAYLNSIWL